MISGPDHSSGPVNATADRTAKIKAVFVDCPRDLPISSRIGEAFRDSDEVKLAFYGGYEHFTSAGYCCEVGGELVTVFRWTGRTEIAE
ncbi:DUF5988 family protein [Thermomonospora umbrina]|uniref:Uncharacterized protein n=1 Tax=Thermomonospora umbrina TaxID=111806 RepID=A0A3D9T243_9ACTN|nr:DUF5988 family protein [Thermomonospora umbrina]REF00424.1 hypothetical protein DFJ69_5959 [Thermomonospora umbrina]